MIYNSHKILSDKNISHKLIDDFLNDYDRKKIFNQSNQYLKKIEKFSDSDLNFHGINFINLIDRNELLEFLMQTLPKILVIKKFLENNNYEKIFLSHEMYEVFNNTEFGTCLEKLNDAKKNYLTFENIQIPLCGI